MRSAALKSPLQVSSTWRRSSSIDTANSLNSGEPPYTNKTRTRSQGRAARLLPLRPGQVTEPNKFVSEIHDRMPMLLKPEQFEPWLLGEIGKEALVPAPEDMLRKLPVSKRVNSSRAPDEDATLIEGLTS
jgi:hypothetical protein